MENNNKIKVIDLRKAIKKIWKHKKVFYVSLPVAIVLSSIIIFSIPRYYISETKLAPELENGTNNGTLGSLASSLGFDLSEMQTTDAITPLLYPDLMEDNGFISSLFYVNLNSHDGSINVSYYDYITKHQKKPWWSSITTALSKLLNIGLENGTEKTNTFDPYDLSREQNNIAEFIRNNININVNSKNGVISISAQAQDPLICRTLADSVREKLQLYITTYRTNKARTDYDYYKKLTDDAKQEYEACRRIYANYSDANTNISLRSVQLKLESIENDMQIKYNTYTTLNNQLQAASAKVQERTPVFTILKGASVPIKPAGPKRMIFIAAIVFLTFIGTSMWILRKDIAEIFV